MPKLAGGSALDRVISEHGAPLSITVDHGTEFTSRALDAWAYRRSRKLDFIQPGEPSENGRIESFNGKLRDECLNANQFLFDRRCPEQERSVAVRLQPASTAQVGPVSA